MTLAASGLALAAVQRASAPATAQRASAAANADGYSRRLQQISHRAEEAP